MQFANFTCWISSDARGHKTVSEGSVVPISKDNILASTILSISTNHILAYIKSVIFLVLLSLVNCPCSRFLLLHFVPAKICIVCCSPLTRSKRTAEIIWGPREEEMIMDSDLREIDLYAFQVSSIFYVLNHFTFQILHQQELN